MRGRLHVVGFGPGGREHMTFKAAETIRNADVVTGYTTYVRLMEPIFPDKEYKATGMMREVDRCRMAIEDAVQGKDVAMVSSGDSGVYGMAGIVYQLAEEMGADIDIDTVPGVTAASTAASVLGAPLMHDTALISLSDLMTPLDLIMKRVECAGIGDMVVCLYNPKSRSRTEYLERAADILMRYRSPDTPVGVVRNAGRDGQRKTITTLGGLKDADVDMSCTVVVGNSQTYVSGDLMITPRGYRLRGDDMAIQIVRPDEIEKRSMEIIASELGGRTWPEPEFSVVRRCIHTSADFDYADSLVFTGDAARIGVEALRRGAHIVTDTKMAAAGINKKRLEAYGGRVHCFMDDGDVASEALRRGCTRAAVCMEKGAEVAEEHPVIFAIGNAPTALVRLAELIDEGAVRPELVVGAPVGFVNVVESKEIILSKDIPCIVPRGRKGGSNIAATICNAMIYFKGRSRTQVHKARFFCLVYLHPFP